MVDDRCNQDFRLGLKLNCVANHLGQPLESTGEVFANSRRLKIVDVMTVKRYAEEEC